MDDYLAFDDAAFRDLVDELAQETLRTASEDMSEIAAQIAKDSGVEDYAESYYVIPSGADGAVVANDNPAAYEVELGSSTVAPVSPMIRALYAMENSIDI
jgi:hypothetical protein